MKYYIKRDLNEYGPYTIADLQRYVTQGNISMNDLTRSEGMTDWVPVSQVVGDIPPPAPPPVVTPTAPAQGGAVYGGTPVAATPGAAYGTAPALAVAGPVPPDLHWALVLLFGFLCSVFNIVWVFIEAGFVKKIKPESTHLMLIITGIAIQFGAVILFYVGIFAAAATASNSRSNEPPAAVFGALGLLVVGVVAGAVVHIIGNFKMRAAMLDYYNTVEPISLRLSGVMTFFFPLFYFQYHFSRIAAWKRTGYLAPQVYQG
jgi:hypothetical protein